MTNRRPEQQAIEANSIPGIVPARQSPGGRRRVRRPARSRTRTLLHAPARQASDRRRQHPESPKRRGRSMRQPISIARDFYWPPDSRNGESGQRRFRRVAKRTPCIRKKRNARAWTNGSLASRERSRRRADGETLAVWSAPPRAPPCQRQSQHPDSACASTTWPPFAPFHASRTLEDSFS